jgi:hypothetical protein
MNTLVDTISGKFTGMNMMALDVLGASRFSNLFWTLVLTGFISAAIPLLVISWLLHPLTSDRG